LDLAGQLHTDGPTISAIKASRHSRQAQKIDNHYCRFLAGCPLASSGRVECSSKHSLPARGSGHGHIIIFKENHRPRHGILNMRNFMIKSLPVHLPDALCRMMICKGMMDYDNAHRNGTSRMIRLAVIGGKRRATQWSGNTAQKEHLRNHLNRGKNCSSRHDARVH
jgi:hypothetical protein